MHLLLPAILLLSWDVQGWMQGAFYPVLLLILVAASLGVPIPEDVPLLAAGVILSQQPEGVTWFGTLAIALLGIMCGDVVLYVLGGVWGPDVYQHRWVRQLISPARLEKMTEKFNRYGMWMCFFGRFFMGLRAAMCITAGVTRFTFWKFLLADLAGALLSIPLFVWLGYWFASMIPKVKTYVHLVQWILLGLALAAFLGFLVYRRLRPMKNDVVATTPAPPVASPTIVTKEAPQTKPSAPSNNNPAARTNQKTCV